MSPLRKVIVIVNPCLPPRPPKGGVLNNEQFAKVPFPRVAEALAEAQGDLGVKLLFGADSIIYCLAKVDIVKFKIKPESIRIALFISI